MYPMPSSSLYQPVPSAMHPTYMGTPMAQSYYPYYPQEPLHHLEHQFPQMKRETLQMVEPFVQHGLKEAQHTSYPHALREVAAISYLLGKGYSPRMAHQIVESWEIKEHF